MADRLTHRICAQIKRAFKEIRKWEAAAAQREAEAEGLMAALTAQHAEAAQVKASLEAQMEQQQREVHAAQDAMVRPLAQRADAVMNVMNVMNVSRIVNAEGIREQHGQDKRCTLQAKGKALAEEELELARQRSAITARVSPAAELEVLCTLGDLALKSSASSAQCDAHGSAIAQQQQQQDGLACPVSFHVPAACAADNMSVTMQERAVAERESALERRGTAVSAWERRGGRQQTPSTLHPGPQPPSSANCRPGRYFPCPFCALAKLQIAWHIACVGVQKNLLWPCRVFGALCDIFTQAEHTRALQNQRA